MLNIQNLEVRVVVTITITKIFAANFLVILITKLFAANILRSICIIRGSFLVTFCLFFSTKDINPLFNVDIGI